MVAVNYPLVFDKLKDFWFVPYKVKYSTVFNKLKDSQLVPCTVVNG